MNGSSTTARPGHHADSRLSQLKLLVAGRLRLGFKSEFRRFGLRRDLATPHAAPPARIPIHVRPLAESDLPVLLPEDASHLEPGERLQMAWRRRFLAKVTGDCFVAVDERHGTPCYMQWLLGPSQNGLIASLGGFPPLAADEALLENAFTPVGHRGLGIMPAAMALIAERASQFGARHVLTFVDEGNIASLKGCQRAGFFPHIVSTRRRYAFGTIDSTAFETLAEGDPRRALRF